MSESQNEILRREVVHFPDGGTVQVTIWEDWTVEVALLGMPYDRDAEIRVIPSDVPDENRGEGHKGLRHNLRPRIIVGGARIDLQVGQEEGLWKAVCPMLRATVFEGGHPQDHREVQVEAFAAGVSGRGGLVGKLPESS